MKTTLTYTFNLPEDTDELQTQIDANKYRAFIEDFENELRSKAKHDYENEKLCFDEFREWYYTFKEANF